LRSYQQTGYTAKGYEITPQGEIGKQVVTLPDYDPRIRPWYQTAVKTGGQAWTPIFMWTSEDVGIDAVVPVYADDNRLMGVLDTSLTLDGIGDFLQSAHVSENGQTFIVDETGLLIASSTIPEPYTRTGEEVNRFSASDCDDSTTRAAAQKLVPVRQRWSFLFSAQHDHLLPQKRILQHQLRTSSRQISYCAEHQRLVGRLNPALDTWF
jgi:hypothetical protein